MTKFSDIYDKVFFEWHRPLRDEYKKISLFIKETTQYDSIIDIGCGCGYFFDGFLYSLKFAIEGSYHCLSVINETNKHLAQPINVSILDVSKPFQLFNSADLVICTEVGEHLPEDAADTLINNIFNHARKDVFFSAATPGQGGHHHLNEQPHSYWIEKFKERGFVVDEERTKKIREFAATTKLSWIRDNAILFTRIKC